MLHLSEMLDDHLQVTQIFHFNGNAEISDIIGQGMGRYIDDIDIIRTDGRAYICKNSALVLSRNMKFDTMQPLVLS